MRKGFTLVELLIAVAVISILIAGLFTYYSRNYTGEARVSKAIELAEMLRKACDNYYDDTGYYPANSRQLWNNSSGVKGWYGPYLTPPSGNVASTTLPSPIGTSASLECVDGSYLRVAFSTVQPSLCKLLERLGKDDGNPSSGKVRYLGGNCYYYLYFGSGVRCK